MTGGVAMAIVAKDASKSILLQIVTSQIGVERNAMPIRMKPHAHLFYEVVFLVKGVLRHHIRIQGELCEREQIVGDIFAIAPNEEHWYDDSADAAYYNLYISPGVFAEMQQRLHSDGGFNSLAMQNVFYRHAHGFQTLHVEGREYKQIEVLCQEAAQEYENVRAGTPLVLQALVSAILTLLCRHWEKTRASRLEGEANSNALIIMHALEYIQEHYAEPINIDALAKSLFVSSDHFRKNFKRVTGTSPVKYINNLRVRHAMDLLKNPSMRISIIAAQTGFGDINNFTRCFTRINRISPSAFRKQVLSRSYEESPRGV